jgi:uncharacterized protein
MNNTSGPWWQHRWPWIILFMLSSVIVACMVTIYIAVTTRDSLVADDYTKHGRGINQRLEKDQRALELGVSAGLGYAFNALKTPVLTIELQAPEPQGADAVTGVPTASPAFLVLELSHPTIAQLDRNLVLRRVSEDSQIYRIQTEPLAAAYWHAAIYPPERDWRVRTRLEVSKPVEPTSRAK